MKQNLLFDVEKLTQQLIHLLIPQTLEQSYCIAFSGGLDSTVLLHSMVKLRERIPTLKLRAIHVNHALSTNAMHWEKHCHQVCALLSVEIESKTINPIATRQSGQSLEAVARELRYQVFRQLLKEGEFLMTAHQQNDQAETILLQLLRGAGPRGLAAMPALTKFASGYLLRPLLIFSRQQLFDYATREQLAYCDDESNIDISFSRNFIRHRIFPLLQQQWPAVTQTFARSANNCFEASYLNEQLAIQDLSTLKTESQNTLDIIQLLKLDPLRQRNVLRYWLRQLSLTVPTAKKLQQLQHDLLHCRRGAQPLLTWDEVQIRRYQDQLYAMQQLPAHDNTMVLNWKLSQPLQLPNQLGQLIAKPTPGKGLKLKMTDHVTVQFRQGGESCQIVGRQGTHQLKKLWQEWKVPPWQRDRIPLIYYRQQLVFIVGYCACNFFSANDDELGIGIFLIN